MFGFGAATRIYLAPGATDMRKGFEGLYGMVRDRLQCDPLSGHVFLFCQRATQPHEVDVLGWKWFMDMFQAIGKRMFSLA